MTYSGTDMYNQHYNQHSDTEFINLVSLGIEKKIPIDENSCGCYQNDIIYTTISWV